LCSATLATHAVIACDWKRNEYMAVSCKSSPTQRLPCSCVVCRLASPCCPFTGHHVIIFAPQEEEFCDEFHLVDLRVFDNCKKVTENVDHVFNLAADMGGMGFIQSNHSVIFYNNIMISFNMVEAARQNKVKR
jgi:nucleoside-diphosphate-sugar epimerase